MMRNLFVTVPRKLRFENNGGCLLFCIASGADPVYCGADDHYQSILGSIG
jgi:hypothetical protein